MRLTENIEKFIRSRKPHTVTGSDTDRRILHDSFAAMDETIHAKSADAKPNTCKVIVQSRMTKIAAAAVIVVVIGFAVHQVSREQTDGQTPSEATKSPAEMLTYASLTVAYRQGGFEEVEKQCEQAFELLGPRPEALSPQQLLAEFNGS
ncbi:MAG TPA: hypothetical protein VMW16_09825 [Sedimentisphaerales bacterium]|nr:hypothetical protein [Sedimentisphaerales bacterium]